MTVTACITKNAQIKCSLALLSISVRNEAAPMNNEKPIPGGRAKKQAEVSLLLSSAAEYLTFVAACGGSEANVEMRYEDENDCLPQKMMAAIYAVSIPAINQHL
jgi:hypothetical protein